MNTKPKKGLRSYYPTDKGPIDTYQLGHDGRIEFIAAEIGTDHLTKGVETTEEWKKWAKERGAETDVPGLIISKRLGGSGIDSVNLFPQSSSLKSTSWGKDEETAFNESKDMKKWKKIKFFARFDYPEDDSLRPSEIEYQYELPSGTILHSKVSNDISKEEDKDTKDAEEESEYEYEYEEEEEEEEKVPDEKVEEKAIVESVPASSPSPALISSSSPAPSPAPPASPSPIPPSPSPVQVEEPKIPKSESPVPPLIPATISYQEPVAPRTPSPTPSYTFSPPPALATRQEDYAYTRNEPPPSNKKQKSPTPSAEKGVRGSDNSLFTRADFIEMLPIIGSIKLALDVLGALFNRNVNLAFWKAIQCGISVLGDFNFMRGFARHGKILIKPLTEEKLIRFANKAEPHIIIFGACKAGNQVLSSLKRILTS